MGARRPRCDVAINLGDRVIYHNHDGQFYFEGEVASVRVDGVFVIVDREYGLPYADEGTQVRVWMPAKFLGCASQ